MELQEYLVASVDSEILLKVENVDMVAEYIVRNFRDNVSPEITKEYIKKYMVRI